MAANPRSVIVTGGVGVLGLAIARAFRDAGERVTLVDAAHPVPTGIASEFSGVHAVHGGIDLTDYDAARRLFASIAERTGGLDVLVNVAGGFRWQTVADGDIATWDLLYGINLKTAVVACKAALPHLRSPGGRIINIGAGAAVRAAAGMGAYAASKAGVQRLTESLAEEQKERGITVNAILPGTIDTPRNRLDMPDADTSRWVQPGSIAAVITFLASAAASAVTGAAIPVSGRG